MHGTPLLMMVLKINWFQQRCANLQNQTKKRRFWSWWNSFLWDVTEECNKKRCKRKQKPKRSKKKTTIEKINRFSLRFMTFVNNMSQQGSPITKAQGVWGDFQTDSPCCSKIRIHLHLTLIPSNKWTLQSADIKTAFLLG